MGHKEELTARVVEKLLQTLQSRYKENINRHKGIDWIKIQEKLIVNPHKLWSINEMEKTGGEPDVVLADLNTSDVVFYDCSKESPEGRRSLCYDLEGLESRKKFKPQNNAINMAASMGVELLTEEQYRCLQQLGDFDCKTSSWLKTPAEIRKLGGAIFGDYRFGNVFIYHNGADSYYAARGFRSCLVV